MAEENQKVVVRFETSQAPVPNTEDGSDTLLMSGPIDVFATLDNLSNNPTTAEMQDPAYADNFGEFDIEKYGEINKVGLHSPYISNIVINEIKTGKGSLVIYVKDVTNEDDITILNNENLARGAYYRFYDITEHNDVIWQEILLGTHSHHNINILEEISSLDYYDEKFPKEGKMLIAKPNGEFELQEIQSFDNSLLLPELPESIKSELARRERLKNILPGIEYPEESEWHHLDAPLEELSDPHVDCSHNTKAIVGNCRELYYALVRAGKYLFLDSNFKLSIGDQDLSKTWLQLHADIIDYNPSNIEFSDGLIHTDSKSGKLFFTVHLPVEVDETDEVFLFSGENHEVFCDSDIIIVDINNTDREITFAVNPNARQVITKEPQVINLMVAKNALSNNQTFRIDFLNALKDKVISLEIIESSLLKAYTAGVISQQVNLPHLYLTTDDNGNVHWENTLIPTQTFYNATEFVEVKRDESTDKVEDLLLQFKGTHFKAKYDFPILIIDGNIDFTKSYNIKPSGDLVYKIEGQFLEERFEVGDKIRIDLIIIRKSSGGSLAEELAQNYISKKDAVEILSRGKLNLEEYAKKSELSKLAKLNHKHSQYALKEHVHDSRYAMFQHTHPELYATIAKITGGEVTEDDLKTWVGEIHDNNKTQLRNVLEELGIEYTKFTDENGNEYWDFIIPDGSITVDSEIIDELNNKIKKENLGFGELPENAKLDAVLATVVRLFEHDKVLDEQVELSDDIIVKYDIGGIKAGTVYHGRRVAETNNVGEEYTPDNLRKILTDMLNPFIDTAETVRLMTPVDVKLEWYVSDGGEDATYTKVDPKRILESEAVTLDNESRLYFKIIGGINADEKPCETYTSTATGVPSGLQKTRVFIKGEDSEYHYYDGNPKDIKEIIFTWNTPYSTLNPNVEENQEVKGIVWDNYGIKYEILNPDENTLTIVPDIQYGYPAIYITTTNTEIAQGKISDEDNFTVIVEDYSNYKMSFLDKPVIYRCLLSETNRSIVMAVREDIYMNGEIMIRNLQTGNRVEGFFWETGDLVEISGGSYVPLAYTVYSDVYNSLDLELSLLKLAEVEGGNLL